MKVTGKKIPKTSKVSDSFELDIDKIEQMKLTSINRSTVHSELEEEDD